jgi:hypothetical protein
MTGIAKRVTTRPRIGAVLLFGLALYVVVSAA